MKARWTDLAFASGGDPESRPEHPRYGRIPRPHTLAWKRFPPFVFQIRGTKFSPPKSSQKITNSKATGGPAVSNSARQNSKPAPKPWNVAGTTWDVPQKSVVTTSPATCEG